MFDPSEVIPEVVREIMDRDGAENYKGFDDPVTEGVRAYRKLVDCGLQSF